MYLHRTYLHRTSSQGGARHSPGAVIVMIALPGKKVVKFYLASRLVRALARMENSVTSLTIRGLELI